ncbi:MAG: PaaI family thioesterase [Bacteroidales bacterium]|nr:PaaI family thioesterase [Bacteroidales bacterium]
MKRKIKNPYIGVENYNCFGCSPDNPIGLQLKFYEEGDFVVTDWQPSVNYQGFVNILHGGIMGTLIDEIASWVIFIKLKTGGFTSNMSLRYKHSVRTDEGPVHLTAKIAQTRRNLVDVDVKLYDCHENLCVEGIVTYFTYSQEKAQTIKVIPKIDAYYEDE